MKQEKTKSKPQHKNKKKPKLSPEEEARLKRRRETMRFLGGITLCVVCVVVLLSMVSYIFTGKQDQAVLQSGNWSETSNWIGVFGAWIAEVLMKNLFGLATIFLPIFFIAFALRIMNVGHIRLWKWFINCTILTAWWSVALQFFFSKLSSYLQILDHFPLGGGHGKAIEDMLCQAVGWFGTAAILLLTAVAYLAYLSSETIDILKKMLAPSWLKRKKQDDEHQDEETTTDGDSTEEVADTPTDETAEATGEETDTNGEEAGTTDEAAETIDLPLEITTPGTPAPSDGSIEFKIDAPIAPETPPQTEEDKAEEDKVNFKIEKPVEEAVANKHGEGALEPYDPKLDLERYKYPVLELLNRPTNTSAPIDYEEQNQNKDRIIKILQNFGVAISSIRATVGPTITLYEIQPAPGVRISKIRNLEDDIALSLSALGIRIIAPIPGKGTIGIEVPNKKPQMVPMESILNSQRFRESDYELPIALGKTITNEVYMVDLAKMPHLLVAGATGQGKSVGLNAIVTSLLYKKHPAELKLVMVDPKKVEFSIYSPLVHHFLAQVEDEDEDNAIITDVKKVVATLNSLCAEMDERYDLLKRCHARNIKEYNAKFKERQLSPANGHRFLPYIVVIIDEFGDLIMTAGKEVELPIARIAQLARAVGIHMIIATQRPTTNIITGTIKANFPARMAFKVSSMIDSRTILDRPGANQLVGKGDMLFLAGADPVRVQCAFVDTPEVERICNYIATQQSYPTSFQLKRVVTENDEDGGPADVDMKHLDPMFDEIARWVVAAQQGSTSAIQRKFSIGYNRAGRITDQLESAGIVGPAQGSKPREVLCISEDDLECKLNNLR